MDNMKKNRWIETRLFPPHHLQGFPTSLAVMLEWNTFFIGCKPGNKALHSNGYKAEPVIWLESVVTFVSMELSRAINNSLGSIQIFQVI